MEYSRDELAGSLRDLDRVLSAVRLGIFDPDATRSGRWIQDESALAELSTLHPSAPTPVRSVPTEEVESSTSGVSSASEVVDTEDASDEEATAAVVAEEVSPVATFADYLPKIPDEGLMRNLANGVLHGARDESHLLCGRAFPVQRKILNEWPRRSWPLCKACFRDQ